MVAAELLGRAGIGERGRAIPALLDALRLETPEHIYDDSVLLWWAEADRKFAKEGPEPFLRGRGSSADAVKRHRLKVAIIEALGKLHAREAVADLCAIVEDQREFYPVHSAACRALGLIGDPAALPTLERAANYPEANTKYRAADAIARIRTGLPASTAYPDRAG